MLTYLRFTRAAGRLFIPIINFVFSTSSAVFQTVRKSIIGVPSLRCMSRHVLVEQTTNSTGIRSK